MRNGNLISRGLILNFCSANGGNSRGLNSIFDEPMAGLSFSFFSFFFLFAAKFISETVTFVL